MFLTTLAAEIHRHKQLPPLFEMAFHFTYLPNSSSYLCWIRQNAMRLMELGKTIFSVGKRVLYISDEQECSVLVRRSHVEEKIRILPCLPQLCFV
jgi:hypothetical protein